MMHPQRTRPMTVAGRSSVCSRWTGLVFLAVVPACSAPVLRRPIVPQATAPPALDACDLVWTTPSRDASGSMPIGNGEVGLNVWVEDGGDLVFLISRTDAWSESCRLLKLGRVRIAFDPNPFVVGAPFRQSLRLREGRIVVETGPPGEEVSLSVSVDTDRPVVRVVGESAKPLRVKASLECWRDARHVLAGEELKSSWTMRDAPASVVVWESPDLVLDAPAAVAWCHRNEHSVVPLTLAHQGLASLAPLVRDPLLGRTFGGWMEANGFDKDGERSLVTRKPSTSFEVRLAAHADQTGTIDAWTNRARSICAEAPGADEALATTERWWRQFWERSWILVDERGSAASLGRITQAYQLQRWVQACGGRGRYPIKFNGSIFTVEPKLSGGPDFDPDWRRWGDCFWWQNTRLPYHSMLASGDFEMMEPLFRLFEEALPLCSARAQLYHGVAGAYFPETMTIFGACSNGDYGWDRAGHEAPDVLCPWWQYAWNQGPELLALMLDRFDYTQDEAFLRREVLPMAESVLAYFDSRFLRDGKLVLQPTQALETHWNAVVDDAPTVAGLHDVLARLRALRPGLAGAGEVALWDRLAAALPAIPTVEDEGVRFLSPARSYEPSRQNCETPELYSVFPFRLHGLGKEGLEIARETYRRRHDRLDHGWPQDGQFAALLGLTDEARRILLAKVGNSNPAHRFPAVWGPNFDWLPDQCHGSNLMHTLQLMLLQSDGERILVLPAWPAEWDVSFRLHAPRNTVVEGIWREGRMQKLEVTPPERRADVVLCHPDGESERGR